MYVWLPVAAYSSSVLREQILLILVFRALIKMLSNRILNRNWILWILTVHD